MDDSFSVQQTADMVPVTALLSSTSPNTDPKQFRTCFPQYVSVINELNAPVQGLEDNALRSRTALCWSMLSLRSTSPYSSLAECQWHFQHQQRVSDSPDSSISTSNIQNCRDIDRPDLGFLQTLLQKQNRQESWWNMALLLIFVQLFQPPAFERRPAQH